MTPASAPGQLEGRTAVITGASRGIGRAIAEKFGAEGARVVVGARTEQKYDDRLPGSVHETVSAIRAVGGEAVAVRCDVAVDEDRIALVERAHEAFGPVDILVNNAALTVPGRHGSKVPDVSSGELPPFVDVPLKAYQRHFEIGVFASYRLIQLVLPDMIAARRGAIVNISSVASRVPINGADNPSEEPVLPGYGGNKAALEHLTRAVAWEMRPFGIAVNALLPSVAIASPGLEVLGNYDGELPDVFAEAALRLAKGSAETITGAIIFHHDLLELDQPPRGWYGHRTPARTEG
jgi:7-alpha-hydroxysteroid dehydrogenase